ncbi:protein of unknown function [Candidatus Nitrosocosmicus franklandus]|uniref:Uncharacterized protein n=1 Tax=Candidatus Nitrosocosmicus franklandianus TaxID=1798806 RepID=A0A484ICG8_9ARCH|nr:protein of unknown function [Candidatus Nitrosocosmicus franklandus]
MFPLLSFTSSSPSLIYSQKDENLILFSPRAVYEIFMTDIPKGKEERMLQV